MKPRKIVRALALLVFSGLFLFAGCRIVSYYGETRAQEAAFGTLQEMVAKGTSAGPSSTAGAAAPAEDSGEEGAPAVLPEYAALHQENPDLFGWVQIPDTRLNYPVMYTPEDPEYYLRRAFDGSDSDSGVPFLDGSCTEDGGNYLIYGHNMNAGTMFALLPSYARQDFWEEHPVIRFDTLYERGDYAVMAAFYSQVYDVDAQGVFRYYQYTDLSSPERFQEYVEQVKSAALYDTGITAEYGDQLLTLSTCNYHTGDGRFVVVARKQAQDGEVH